MKIRHLISLPRGWSKAAMPREQGEITLHAQYWIKGKHALVVFCFVFF